VTNTGNQNMHSWMVHWTWPSGVTLTNIWNAEHSSMGGVEMAGPSWNGSVATSGSIEFGMNVSGALTSAPEFECFPS